MLHYGHAGPPIHAGVPEALLATDPFVPKHDFALCKSDNMSNTQYRQLQNYDFKVMLVPCCSRSWSTCKSGMSNATE